ncbi:MAG: radical SAM protein [Thermoguttaceae bacterium]|jgi:wyosine [tRNA(Phe)-imidazoG37] synthetase (radical SAM superfamily)
MPASNDPLFAAHPRDFKSNLYVYPVLSRRAGGISIGVNLNRNKFCNFHCIYCQVDLAEPSEDELVDLQRLEQELDRTVELVTSGRIFEDKQFGGTPAPLRRLNDIAFSGDGEPTAYRNFAQAVAACAEVRRRRRLDDVKLVLITNASLLHRWNVLPGLEILDQNNGEIWAKLDAGSEAYYHQVARSAVPFKRILENLRDAARARPIVIQTLFMRINGIAPSLIEIEAYCGRLQEIVAAGGKIKLVQIHTIARRPAESWVAPLTNAEVDSIAETVRRQTGLPVAAFYG